MSVDGELGKCVGMWIPSLIPRPRPSWPEVPDLFHVHVKVVSMNVHSKYVYASTC